MTSDEIQGVREVEFVSMALPQIDIATTHVIHAGMYARTIFIPAGVLVTGVLIKIGTILIVCGNVLVYLGDEIIELQGYNVLPASANRKQAFATKTDTYLTMIFPSNAENVEKAEKEFTDEVDMLISRNGSVNNQIIITGE